MGEKMESEKKFLTFSFQFFLYFYKYFYNTKIAIW